MPQWAVLLERQGLSCFLRPFLSTSVANGEAKAGHTSPYRGRSVLHRGERSQRAQTHRIGRLLLGRRMGQPVCAPATSSGGGGARPIR